MLGSDQWRIVHWVEMLGLWKRRSMVALFVIFFIRRRTPTDATAGASGAIDGRPGNAL
jgi:hypothetical protein